MNAINLVHDHKYKEAAAMARSKLSNDPNDGAALATLAVAYYALGDYPAALPLYQRVNEKRRKDLAGSPGYQEYVSCLHWLMGERDTAAALMRELVDGIFDGSVRYADMAGGVKQGILLHYMGVTAGDPGLTDYALKYLKKLGKRRRSSQASFPGPVGRYLLGEIDFADMLDAATGRRDLDDAIERARVDVLSRRRLCIGLFHDGAKFRALGDEAHCLGRMRQCYALENPIVEQEWYLARYEVEQAVAVGAAG